MSRLSIIIPVYYNHDNLRPLYADLQEKVLPSLEDYEIVMVDDGSKDDSWSVMQEIAGMDSHVVLLRLSRNFGSHAAILAGLDACTGDCAVIKAADLQEPSELLLEMHEKWREGNKVVLAVRADREDSWMQKAFANAYYRMVQKYALSNMPDHGFDIYLIDRQVIELLKLLDEKNSALTLQILWTGFKSAQVSYVRRTREIGTSKWTLSKKIKLVIDSMVSFSFAPIRLVSYVGIIAFIVSIIWAIVVIVSRLHGSIPVPGYTTLAILILFSSGCIMLTLGIIGEYLWRAVDNSRNRPVYIVEEKKSSEKQQDDR